jgi:hypothetical protein
VAPFREACLYSLAVVPIVALMQRGRQETNNHFIPARASELFGQTSRIYTSPFSEDDKIHEETFDAKPNDFTGPVPDGV